MRPHHGQTGSQVSARDGGNHDVDAVVGLFLRCPCLPFMPPSQNWPYITVKPTVRVLTVVFVTGDSICADMQHNGVISESFSYLGRDELMCCTMH